MMYLYAVICAILMYIELLGINYVLYDIIIVNSWLELQLSFPMQWTDMCLYLYVHNATGGPAICKQNCYCVPSHRVRRSLRLTYYYITLQFFFSLFF